MLRSSILPPCHTLSHISGPRKYVTHLGPPPDFSRSSTTNPDKNPPYKFYLDCSRRFCSRRFCQGVFCLEGFVRVGFCPFPLLSQYICCYRKLNITLNFMLRMYDKNLYNRDVTCS